MLSIRNKDSGPQSGGRANASRARTTKWQIVAGVEQEACKSGIRRLRLVRLHTAGDRQRAAVSSARSGLTRTVDVRTADGTVRRGSNPGCPVLAALPIRQRQQRRRLPARRTQQPRGRTRHGSRVALRAKAQLMLWCSSSPRQVGADIRHKDMAIIVLPVWSSNSVSWDSSSSSHRWIAGLHRRGFGQQRRDICQVRSARHQQGGVGSSSVSQPVAD